MAHHYGPGLYMIRCKATGEFYIGSSTTNTQMRLYMHKSMLRRGRHTSPRMQVAWDTYGEDAFEFRLLKALPALEVRGRELEAIQKLNPAFNTAHTTNHITRHSEPTDAVLTYRRRIGIPVDAPVCRRKGAKYEVRGEELSVEEISKRFNVPLRTLMKRIYAGERGDALARPTRAARKYYKS